MKLRNSNSSRFALYSEIQLMFVCWPICTRKASAKKQIAGSFCCCGSHPQKDLQCREHSVTIFWPLGYEVLCWGYLVRGAKCRGAKEKRVDRESLSYRQWGTLWSTSFMVTWNKICSVFSRNFPMYQTFLSICKSLLHTFASKRQETCQHHWLSSMYSGLAPSAASGLDI